MTIQVKATRQTEPTDTPADRYRFNAAQVATRLPLLFGVALAAVLGFIKTALPDSRLPMPEEPETAPEPETPMASFTTPAEDMSRGAEALRPEDPLPPRTHRPRDDDFGRGSHHYDNVIQFPVRQHALIDSPPIAFADIILPEQPDSSSTARSLGDGGNSRKPGAAAASAGGGAVADIERRNRAPESRGGPVRLQEAFAGTAMVIGLDQLLAQTSDPDGDALTVKNVRVSTGSIAQTEAGLIYTSSPQAEAGPVLVNFEVSDGVASVALTALIPLVRGPIAGTQAAEHIVGTIGTDMIDGLAGADIIDAMAGDDFIAGGDGDDIIVAGAGNDVVRAGRGNDVVMGGDGNDVLSGEAGDDRLAGDAGNDVVNGGDGDDVAMGGEGDDDLSGEAGDDRLAGDAGNDVISGGTGDDHLAGGDGVDLLQGDAGADEIHDGNGEDVVFGGAGDDLAVAAMDAAIDYLEGGEGFDTADYSAAVAPVTFDLEAGSIDSVEAGNDEIAGFEAVIGGSAGDTFMVGEHEMQLTGGDGDDTFVFALPEQIDRPTLVHDILDFIVGDRIKVAAFEFTMDQNPVVEDRFGRYYRDREEPDPNALELRIRHVQGEDGAELTVFEFDTDGNFEFEMTVTVHGYQQPFVYETATA